MAGYWPRSFFASLWTSTSPRSINMQKKNLANIQPSWPHTWSITNTSCPWQAGYALSHSPPRVKRGWDGAVVRALASHCCGQGFDFQTRCHMWVEFAANYLNSSLRPKVLLSTLLAASPLALGGSAAKTLFSAPSYAGFKGFSPGSLVFLPPQKFQFKLQIPIQSGNEDHMSSSVNNVIYLFILSSCLLNCKTKLHIFPHFAGGTTFWFRAVIVLLQNFASEEPLLFPSVHAQAATLGFWESLKSYPLSEIRIKSLVYWHTSKLLQIFSPEGVHHGGYWRSFSLTNIIKI